MIWIAAFAAFMALLGLSTAEAQNFVTNPDFDDTLQLTGWEALGSSWDTLDWQDQVDSGSVIFQGFSRGHC